MLPPALFSRIGDGELERFLVGRRIDVAQPDRVLFDVDDHEGLVSHLAGVAIPRHCRRERQRLALLQFDHCLGRAGPRPPAAVGEPALGLVWHGYAPGVRVS